MREIPTHAVKAVIRNANGEILFLRRHKQREGVTNWDLPGGLVESDEEEISALEREVEEEVRKKITIGRQLGQWSFHRALDDKMVNVQNYEGFLADEDILLSDEHDEAKWIPESDLASISLKDDSILQALN